MISPFFLNRDPVSLNQNVFPASLVGAMHISGGVDLQHGVADPVIEDFHLLRRVEPVFLVLHYGEVCANSVCKSGNGFSGSQMIPFPIQNAGGYAPRDGMLSHIAQILPG